MSLSTKSYTPKAREIQRDWRIIDASGRPLGRLASEIAQVLRGKDKPIYTPHLDTGDFVIVVNAAKVRVTGSKSRDKMYYSHSMYPGGFKSTSLERMLATHPRRVIEEAVWGMLPQNRLGRTLLGKLKVYAEETHPHGAQVKELARPEKAGRPGKPRPPKKVRVRPEPVAPELRPQLSPAVPEEPVPEPVSTPAAEAAPQPPESLTPVAVPFEEAQPEAEVTSEVAEPAPLAPPPRLSRSRQARAREAREARTSRPAGKTEESSHEQSSEQAEEEEA